MFFKALPFTQKLLLFIFLFLKKLHKNPKKPLKRTLSNTHINYPFSLAQRSDFSQKDLIFDVEGTLLRSFSTFSYFMLVAFEGGSLIRALILFFLYPFLCLVNDELSIKIMVMVCFFGIKKANFRVGTSVLPKFFMEDVAMEGFEVVRKGKKKIGVSKMPQVMVECFLKDYLEIDFVVGREIKIFGGYYLGIMKDNKNYIKHCLSEVFEQDDGKVCSSLVGFLVSKKSMNHHHHHWISSCKEIYVANDVEKMTWRPLPKEKYPKALIFHDGRLAFKPDPLPMLSMLMWIPFGLTLSIFRSIVSLLLPYCASIPILGFTGMKLDLANPNPNLSTESSYNKGHKGLLYVCNHRTLLDPLYLSFGLKKRFAAVTYSLSRISEILSPIMTVRLTRDRDQDAKRMDKMLREGDLVVCPEGTTCREPYLLRFSPLFSELSEEIVPVALDTYVSMFYGTTAGGLKCLDPFLFLMNPHPFYRVRFLEKVRCGGDEKSRFEVANYVQREMGKALGFECTSFTRKDKYLVLAGNEGFVSK